MTLNDKSNEKPGDVKQVEPMAQPATATPAAETTAPEPTEATPAPKL